MVAPMTPFEFQSTSPRGGRRNCVAVKSMLLLVSIHVPARGTTPPEQQLRRSAEFQSTSPRGGRPQTNRTDLIPVTFQSTSPRGGRLSVTVCALVKSGVSIHVPARATTPYRFAWDRFAWVSIHVPARGTTAVQVRAVQGRVGFNPRPRAGDDPPAPCRPTPLVGFNPRPRAGDDSAVRPPYGR